jgi:very-short-patch-repair endonuclease
MIIKETVRLLRKKSTPAEKIFWEAVRNRKLLGLKFFRQHPIECDVDGKKRFFIADFYNAEHNVVIEIDGGIHESQKDYDDLRTFVLSFKDIKVIRFSNEEIITNIGKVLNKLKKELGF